MKLLLILIALLLSACTHQTSTSSTPQKSEACTDFLAKWKMDHPQIKFVGCEKEDEAKHAQPKLFAKYSVKGTDAKSVEKYLGDKFKMRPLDFVCCGWSPEARNDTQFYPDQGRGTYLDVEYENYFTIALTSGETIEKDWNKIDFTVVIETHYKEI